MSPLLPRVYVGVAALLALIGVGLGAFGAHGLASYFAANPDREPTFATAVQYHLIHALAIFGTAWAVQQWPNRWTRAAGSLFAVGIVLFSGSLYLLSLLQIGLFGAVAPLGGAALLGGWLCLGIAAWRGPRAAG
ncbi:MAG: DUF423 domain-containing protein [Chloroflexi bacterium]|nr:DUF423 domain-containing protein [Chloroflexota bacterium]